MKIELSSREVDTLITALEMRIHHAQRSAIMWHKAGRKDQQTFWENEVKEAFTVKAKLEAL